MFPQIPQEKTALFIFILKKLKSADKNFS